MPRERRSTEDRQRELTDAALDLIASRGIAALSTRSLAEAVGLSSGAIFRHFPSLDALLLAVVGRVEEVLDASYPPAALPPTERLQRFIEARSSAVGRQRGILRLMLSEQFQLALPADGSARLSACVDKTRAFLAETIRAGQRDGTFRADLPPDALASIVMGTVQVLAVGRGGKLPTAVGSAARHALDVLLAAPKRPASARRR